jgi:hypothetical protein
MRTYVCAVERLGSELHAYFSIDAPPASGPAAAPLSTGLRTAADADADADLPGTAHNGVARLDPRVVVRPGARVTLRVDPGRLYFFDPATGQATGWPAGHAALPGPVLPGTAPAPALPSAPALLPDCP